MTKHFRTHHAQSKKIPLNDDFPQIGFVKKFYCILSLARVAEFRSCFVEDIKTSNNEADLLFQSWKNSALKRGLQLAKSTARANLKPLANLTEVN